MILLDEYSRKARLYPSLIVILPIVLVSSLYVYDNLTKMNTVYSIIVSGGGFALLNQFGRDFGKRKESALFAFWGGKPTTQELRFVGTKNKTILERRREKIIGLFPGTHLPTEDEELADLRQADEVYDTIVRIIISRTRNRKEYSLLFNENCNYGFRRNLWGMKPIGITIVSVSLAALSFMSFKEFTANEIISKTNVVIVVILLILLLMWLLLINSSWVKETAESYKDRLFEYLDKE